MLLDPSINQHVDQATSLSIDLSLHHATSLTVNPPIHPGLSPSNCLSMSDHLHTIFTSPSDCPSQSDCLYTILPSPSDCPSTSDHLYNNSNSLSDYLSLSDHLYNTMTCLSAHLSSNTTHCSHSSSQSLAVVNGSNAARPRNSIGPLLTSTYFYMLYLHAR